MKVYSLYFKRIIDVLVSLTILFIALPLLIFLSILLLIQYKGSPFFIQLRPGKNEKLFRVIKFKTMNDNKDENGELLSDEKRLTNLGGFIRKTSIDELPQLINVLLGEMSLIGPRPLLQEYLPLYSITQVRRHEVRPGITGWAQVNGRNALSWEERFKLDIWYVDHVSFLIDLKILYLTLIKVIKRDGISGGGVATMTYFTGTKNI